MNLITRFFAWLREEGTAGEYLKPYESKRYSWMDKQDYQGIIIPTDAPTFADVSFYQARMDWDKYPHKSAIIRIGQNVWKDTEFEYNYEQCKARGIKLGGYFFWDDRVSPLDQLRVIKSAMSGKSFELELFIDDEKTYGGAYSDPTHMIQLMQWIESASIACKEVGIYTGYYYWKDNRLPKLTTAQKDYVVRHPLWLAWYASASVVQVPLPWTNATHWQYWTPVVNWGQPTAEIDANRFVGTQAEFDTRYGGTTVPDNDVITTPFDGITTITGKRNGWSFTIDCIDPLKCRFQFVHGNKVERPSNFAKQYGAQLAYNGGEWSRDTLMPQDWSVSDGVIYVSNTGLGRPSFIVKADLSVKINHIHETALHVITGLRYILQNGVLPSYLFGTEPQYTEGHPRTIYGIDVDGCVMVMVSDGLYPNQGLTLKEAAEVMKQYGAVVAFDAGGGGDSVRVMNGVVTNAPQDGSERYVPETVMIFAKENPVTTITYYKARTIEVTKVCDVPKGNQIGTLQAYVYIKSDKTSGADVYNDQWAHIYEPLNGWVNRVSLTNWTQVTEEVPVEPPPVEPPPVPVDDEIEILVNGELKYHIIGKLQ